MRDEEETIGPDTSLCIEDSCLMDARWEHRCWNCHALTFYQREKGFPVPFVHESRKEDLSMRKLGEVANVDIVHLYEVVTANIYKSPRDMARKVRLKKAAELLATTDMPLEKISDECGFYTPNYLMGNFFHEYKQTPTEYREEKRGH